MERFFRMKKYLIIILCLSLFGCAQNPNYVEKPFSEPQYGMTKKQMIDLLGKPESIEIYKKSDLDRIEFYIYVRSNGSTQEKVPVCLMNNKIVGWGETYYEDHISPDDTRIK